MEEWVGERWHRLIMRVADPSFMEAAVPLEDVTRAVEFEVFTSFSHEFANGWKLTGDYSYLTGKSDIVSGIAGTYEINPDYSALFTSDRDRSKYRDQDFSLTLDGDYPALGRSHEFNAGISYQGNRENLSFYQEGESIIPDLRQFDGNVAQPDMPYLRDGFTNMKNLSVYGSTRFKPL